MEQSFTPYSSLIRLLYKETLPSETSSIEHAIGRNYALKEEYDNLKKAFLQLPKVKFKPSEDTISSVLSYSKLHLVGSNA